MITGGPYRVIRHQSYAGILLAVTGLGLFVRTNGSPRHVPGLGFLCDLQRYLRMRSL